MKLLDHVIAAAGTRPANAYLFVGGADATRVAARRVAGALMRERATGEAVQGLQAQAVERGTHPDCIEVEPAGAATYLAGQLESEILPAATLAPLEASRKVVVIVAADVLGDVLGSALLKTIEEPPESTSFILCSVDQAAVPDTIVSRCIVVPVAPLPPAVAGAELAEALDVDAGEAARIVRATGSVEIARLVLGDPEWAARRLLWLELPTRLYAGEPLAWLVDEVVSGLDAAARSLAATQKAERQELEEYLGDGRRGGGRPGRALRGRAGVLNAIEERQRREQRYQATAHVRVFLATLAGWYRDAIAVDGGAALLNQEVVESVAEARVGVAEALAALRAVGTAVEALEFNPNLELLLENVLVTIRAGAARPGPAA